jgi:hypothetical protein
MLKATNRQIAIQNIAWATVEIERLEAAPGELDGEKLTSLYKLRGKEILAGLRNGATVDELAAITGNGI